jgi:hypothetical protein
MGILTATVRFAGPLPTSTDLVAALCQHIGEVVHYDEELCDLTCPVLKETEPIGAVADPQQKEWELRTLQLKGSYFWYAALVVLERMGGEQVDVEGKEMLAMRAPIWAYKAWPLAKKEYRWRNWRRPSWITLEEASRLNILK